MERPGYAFNTLLFVIRRFVRAVRMSVREYFLLFLYDLYDLFDFPVSYHC